MRPSRNISATASSLAKAPGWPIAVAPIIRHHPADASMYASSSMTSIWVTGSASAPPRDCGSLRAKSPASRMAATAAGARVPSRSDSSAPAATTSRVSSTASSRKRRFSRRPVGPIGPIGNEGKLILAPLVLSDGRRWVDGFILTYFILSCFGRWARVAEIGGDCPSSVCALFLDTIRRFVANHVLRTNLFAYHKSRFVIRKPICR